MADRTASDTRLHISATPPYQISKDFQGPDNPIPLSPQWLLPKPGESKPGTGSVENHVVPTPPYGNRSETVKTSGNDEDLHDAHKRKDVFRPSMLDSESGRRDRWRDEERDTKFIRKDRWKDGDKDLGDGRRGDRWTENMPTRHFGESRRGIPERWNDSSNKDTNYDQRRESKWNTRWGPDDKDPESLREKHGGSRKDGEVHMDKGLSNIFNHGKDEKEGDHYRPWKPNSSQSRGRAEPPYHQSLTPNRQVPTFSYGRGRGENMPPVFSLGRGRGGPGGSPMNSISPYSHYPGTNADKIESVPGEPGLFMYSRTKLFDVYRVTDMHMTRKFVDEFVQVPYLTQDEPLEPLALCVPTPEEQDVLKGIDKGEIISSGAPQVPKDGWNSTDVAQSRRMKLGGTPLQDKGEDIVSFKLADEVPGNRELTIEGGSVNPAAGLRAMPLSDHSNTLHNVPGDLKSRNLDMSWSHQPKEPHSQRETDLSYLSETKDVSKWQTNEDPIVKRQLSGIFDSGFETRRVPQAPPEELSLFYKDPQGQIQGPFKGIDIIGWFEAGYFGIDLPVRLEKAAADSPWLSLGDAMPHLRAKARPPPGFSAPKSNDYTDASGWQNSNAFGNIHSGLSEIEIMRNDSRNRQSSATEAENRFLESLMSGNKSSPPLDSQTLSEGVETGNNLYMLAKRMALERQKSIPNTYQYWPGRDVATLVSKSDIVPDPPATPHSKLFASASDSGLQPRCQNADLMSIIQGLSDRSSTGLNNGVAGWSNYSVQGGLDSLQNKIDTHPDQNFPQGPLGIQQQRLQTQNQLPFSNLAAQVVDNPSGVLTVEKLLSSGLSHDPQVLNMLQQQYLMHSQAAVPLQQMSLLDKLFLLKQQQQEEQQQLLRQQQQQQLISQVLQEHQSQQRYGDPSYAQLQGGGIPMGNLRVDPSQHQLPQEIFPISSQTPVPIMQDTLAKTLSLPVQPVQDTSYVSSETSASPISHQIFGNITHQKSWGPILPEQSNELHQKESLRVSTIAESSILHENRMKEEPVLKSLSVSDTAVKSLDQMPDNTCKADDDIFLPATSESGEHSIPVQSAAADAGRPSAGTFGIESPAASNMGSNMKTESDGAHEEQPAGKDRPSDEPTPADVKNIEAREPKKASEKKSKKQKSSKSQSSEQAKGLPKNLPLERSKQSETLKPNTDTKLGEASKGEPVYETNLPPARDKNNKSIAATKVADQDFNVVSATVPGRITEIVVEGDAKAANSVSAQNTEVTVGRAWKPAMGIKAKSLLEIQQEEQRKARTETLVSEMSTSVNSMSLSTPWSGVVASPDVVKVSNESQKELGNTEYLSKPETSQNAKGKKSQLHDILAEEVLKEFSERDAEILEMSSSQNTVIHFDSIDDDNFIEAKDSKRSRKKSTKSKGSGAKISNSISSSEVAIGTSSTEKGKSSRTLQVEKEVVPGIPVGPSLGDFVPWKGEPVSPSPSPAWSADAGRVPKPTSLRDILKEQEKKASAQPSQLPTPQKSHPAQAVRGTGSSWPISASSPSKASPIQTSSHSAPQSKYKVDDDLFWGPIEQSKQETKQSDFPQLASEGSVGSRKTPIKSNSPGTLNRQKSISGKPAERSLPSSPASSVSSLKLRKDAVTKHSEAMDFRDWCENECVRLIGTKDTSFLEFCLKQSRSEAEMLLIENLGSYDPDHEFIDKFLNYKELLPSDVLEIAFQSRSDHKVPGLSVGDTNPGNADMKDLDSFGPDGSSKGGGKKKAKKGKKVSPSVLGFNVVSNRIMMGEIQTVED
ncbi:protein ESSENTIAL FOR POTEXVIRUS ACCUMULATION 1 [Prosopis cineraria]|uniref:protein ESSENTIAL FOR POTEXVIRUS ACCUMULATION 1 n=1 Tax=Prosopis cineraria TaxID=364024 RepID=UPI00240FBF7F|nr:protein ESSENTIAL FOR POTEXVIRUS ACCUMULATION 1 [Prosopis cineraria]